MNKQPKNQLYKRLSELSLIISCNLIEINDINFVKEVLHLIKSTRVSIFSNLFEDVIEYYKMHRKFPDFEYLDMHFPELLGELEGEEPAYHFSFQEEYLKLLKRDSVLQQIEQAISEDDLELVDSIIAADPLFNTDKGKLKTWDDLFDAYLKIKNTKDPLSFGVKELDEMYQGLCYGTLNILAAPPGKFKTTTMCSVAYKNFSQGKKVLFITLEDSWDIIHFNFATREAYEQDRKLSASKMKIGRLDEYDEESLKKVCKDCAKKYKDNLRVACQETWDDFSPNGLIRLLRQVYQELGGLDLVILDHASLLKFYSVRGVSDSKEVINFYIRFLTNLSLSFEDKFALLVAMQTNREGIKELESGKTGSLTNLAEANEAERSASTVTLIYSGPNAVESNIINFYPKKNRRGYLTAKPVISFIDPEVYFVGERAVEGDVSLDDLIDEMNDREEPQEESKKIASTKSYSNERERTPNRTTKEPSNTENNGSSVIRKRKVKKLNKGIAHAATV